MKIFKFKEIEGVTVFVFAPSELEAIEFYKHEYDLNDLSEYQITEVEQHLWPMIYIIDPDEQEPYEQEDYNQDEYSGGYKIIESFAEYAARETQIDIICTSEL